MARLLFMKASITRLAPLLVKTEATALMGLGNQAAIVPTSGPFSPEACRSVV